MTMKREEDVAALARTAIELAEAVLGTSGTLPERGAAYWKKRALDADARLFEQETRGEMVRLMTLSCQPDWIAKALGHELASRGVFGTAFGAAKPAYERYSGWWLCPHYAKTQPSLQACCTICIKPCGAW